MVVPKQFNAWISCCMRDLTIFFPAVVVPSEFSALVEKVCEGYFYFSNSDSDYQRFLKILYK